MRNSLKIILVFTSILILASPMMLVNGPSVTTSAVTPQQVNIVSQAGYTVLFDEAHTGMGSASFTPGNASYFAWILEEYGYETDMNFDQTLDSGILTGIDALVLVFPMVALTTAEVTAVHNFVEGGGDLLLVGTEDSNVWHFTPVNLNAVSTTYGITFTTNSWLGIATDMATHHLTQDVSSIHSNLDYKFKGCTLDVTSPATTVIEYDGNPVAAVSQAGTGKVAAVGALAPFIQYRWGMNWQNEYDDFFQFTLNIFDWFAGVAPRKVVVPDTAVITVGPGPALSPAEVESYGTYTGIIHDHTTHSDGQGTPMEMVWSGYTRGLDYMVITDHSYEVASPSGNGGITGSLAALKICEDNGLNIEQFVGAELSHGHHSLAFPLTSNIYVDTQQEMVDGAHAQGAMIALCHPTTSVQYMDTYMKFDTYGYDAIEVDNTGFIHGLFDEGFTRPFYGASDGHSPEFVGTIVNIAFVDTPTGPDGRLSDTDLMDAILDKRIVIRDFMNDVIYGQQVWVDRYLELMAEAETEMNNAENAISLVSKTENQILLSDLYLRDAEIAFNHGSPTLAINASLTAQTTEALGITLETISPIPNLLDPLKNYTLSLNITNYLGYGVEFNTTVFRTLELTIDTINEIVTIPSMSSYLLNKSLQVGDQGYVLTAFNLHSFNTTTYLSPLLHGVGQLIFGENFSAEYDVGYTGTNATGIFPINRGDSRYLVSGTLFYNTGEGWQNTSAVFRTVTIEATIGPFQKGTAINWYLVAYDMFGSEFTIQGWTVWITQDPLEPTTTTTTTTTTETPIDPMLLVAIGGAGVAVVVIVVIVMKKRGA
ncbi:hypothetical protein EU528_11660 [Candidatus Thorarchaeota archaeon]|nr:MAG: hypothetical protein EU528_11660 [Candidatus Thorarchaeota archaeon]